MLLNYIMRSFEGISFWWAVVILAVIGFIYAVRAFLGYRAVARDAEDDFNYKQPQGMIDKRLSKEGYIRAYKRFHNPRGPAYVAVTVGAILVLTWPAMALLEFILEQAWQLSGRSRVIEPGFLVWQFIIFFSIIGIWVAISYVISKRYHRLAPGTFAFEIEQELLFDETGKREKASDGNDGAAPPYLIEAIVILLLILIIYRGLVRFGYT